MNAPRPPADRPDASAPAARRIAVEGETAAAAFDRVLPEAEYRDRLAAEAAELLSLELYLRGGVEGDLSRRFCLRVAEDAERLEQGLLEVGARGNRRYAFFAEAVSALRVAAKTLHALLHLRGRIRRYLGDRADLATFRHDLDVQVAWLSDRVEAVLASLRAEADRLAMRAPDVPFDPAALRGEEARWRLPQDAEVPEEGDERDRVRAAAAAFLRVADAVEAVRVPDDDDGLEAVARGAFGDAAAHEVRVRMHAVQSGYDAAVAGSVLEAVDPRLRTFRGYVSILLHLLEAVAYLLTLWGRVSAAPKATPARLRLDELLPLRDVLRRALHFGVRNAAACFAEARAVAKALLDGYSRVREVELALPPGRKLHLRPAGLIVRVVQRHGLPVEMAMGEQSVDARQLMDVILLAAGNPAATTVRFRGDERPLSDLEALFAHRLGEDGFEHLPSSLAYLREPTRPS